MFENIKVGDFVFLRPFGGCLRRVKVTRVLKTCFEVGGRASGGLMGTPILVRSIGKLVCLRILKRTGRSMQ